MKNAILEARAVTKVYKGSAAPVLSSVDVTIYEGDLTVIMGSSGAGKSTLLYALSGMDSISSGEVFYKGSELFGLSQKKLAQIRAEEFGFVFQQTNLVSTLIPLRHDKRFRACGYAADRQKAAAL